MFLIRTIRGRSHAVMCLFIAFSMCFLVHAQDTTLKKEAPKEAAAEKNDPVAVPVLTIAEAKTANEDALKEYRMVLLKKTIIRKVSVTVFYLLTTLIAVSFIAFLYKKKKIRKTLLKVYSSPLGRMFYSTRFCRWDYWGMLIVFGFTFFFSMLSGQKAMMNGYIGNWYAETGGRVALSIYNTGLPKLTILEPGSKLEDFIRKGTRGDIQSYSLSNDEAVPIKESKDVYGFLESTGIAWLIAGWWKLIGHPDWSTLYILLSIIYGMIIIAAYCALRQLTGLFPSVALSLLLSSYPTMMEYGIFHFRDGMRALPCYIIIAVLLYLSKRTFNWKGTISCGILLFIICSLSTYFRNDFIVFVPFVLICAFFFHGKVFAWKRKKAVILLCILSGFFVAYNLPGISKMHGMAHVLYIGMADHPFMDNLHFSSDNYTKGISYADEYGFIFGASKAYREKGTLNVQRYSKEYDQTCQKEILSLFLLYPYDFFRLAFSSLFQAMHMGTAHAKNKFTYIDSAPGYQYYQEHSKNIYSGIPSWYYIVIVLLTILLLLFGGRFCGSIPSIVAFVLVGGVYMLQFHVRHYFYIMLVPLLATGFVFDRMVRVTFITIKNYKYVLNILYKKRRTVLLNSAILLFVVSVTSAFLFCSKLIQKKHIEKEILNFSSAKTENIPFQTKTVQSRMAKWKKYSATEVLLPDLYNNTLNREAKEQNDFCEFIKVTFQLSTDDPNETINVLAEYEDTLKRDSIPLSTYQIVMSTNTCTIPMTFVAKTQLNTLYFPVYFSRTRSPFIGFELYTNNKDVEILSVERVIETDKIHTQSAFLVPSELCKMQYFANIDWSKILLR